MTRLSPEARAEAYRLAKKAAQEKADETGFDWGLEWSEFEQKFHVFSLPAKDRRFGFELRCEVVSCSNWDRIRPGHGGKT